MPVMTTDVAILQPSCCFMGWCLTLGSRYHRFSIAQEQQSSSIACPWTEEQSNKGFLAGCSGKPSKARKLIWFHWTGGKFNKILHESHNKMGGGEGHDSRSISCWHLPGPFAPPSLSWWFALQPKVWDRFFGLERTKRVLCWLGAPKSIFSLCGKKKELFLLILNKRRKKNLPASLPS